MSMTLDGRLQDAMCEASPRSRPSLHYYLVSLGLAQFIRDLDDTTRDNLYLVGDLALHSSFVEYMLAKRRPLNVGTAFCNTIKTRTFCTDISASLMNTANPKLLQKHSTVFLAHCWLVLVGAITQHLSSDDFFAWFTATYGPLLDAEAAAYTDYVEEYACEESLLDLTADATPGKTSKLKNIRSKKIDPKSVPANIESFFAALDSSLDPDLKTDIQTAADPTPSSPSEREVAELMWAEDTDTETTVGRLNLADTLLFSSNASSSPPLSRSQHSEQNIADMLLLETDDDDDTTTAPSSFASSPSQDEIQSFLSIPPTPMGADRIAFPELRKQTVVTDDPRPVSS
ncbi:hypothetical protein C8R46DRAFT_1188042 [Mycena filopes]|nr:hypothetical protein C8R46DRAFT_1188042 [Mycena filopes]